MSEEIVKNETVKKGDTKIGAVIVLVISALVFLPAGGAAVYQSLFNKNKADSYGAYNKKQIKYEPGSKFFNAASNIAQSYQSMGYQVNEQTYYYILNQAFNQTILDMAFSDEIAKANYSVPKDAVNRAILPYFYDANGTFSQKLYNQADQGTITNLRENAEGGLIYQRFVDDVFGANSFNKTKIYGLKSSESEKKFISSMGAEKHSFEIVAFDTADYPKAEAEAYAKDNKEKFNKYDLSVITLDDEAEAKALLKKINASEITFEDAVSEKSEKYYSNAEGKVSNSYRYQLVDTLDEESNINEVIGLAKDEISDVVKTKRGYSIFKADSEMTPADLSDEKTMEVAMNYIKANEAGMVENYFVTKAETFTTEAAVSGFDAACKKYSVEKKTVDAFPINYGNSDMIAKTAEVTELESLSSNADALKTAFALKKEEVSSPVVLGSNVVVFKCTDIVTEEPDTSSLADSIVSADQASLQKTLMASSKVENNFFATYLKNMSK